MISIFRSSVVAVGLSILCVGCKKMSEGKAPESAAGQYCDRAAKVEIKIKTKSLAYIKRGVGPLIMTWTDDINGYFVQMPGRAYKLEYKKPDFALHLCSSPTECKFQRMITKCD